MEDVRPKANEPQFGGGRGILYEDKVPPWIDHSPAPAVGGGIPPPEDPAARADAPEFLQDLRMQTPR